VKKNGTNHHFNSSGRYPGDPLFHEEKRPLEKAGKKGYLSTIFLLKTHKELHISELLLLLTPKGGLSVN